MLHSTVVLQSSILPLQKYCRLYWVCHKTSRIIPAPAWRRSRDKRLLPVGHNFFPTLWTLISDLLDLFRSRPPQQTDTSDPLPAYGTVQYYLTTLLETSRRPIDTIYSRVECADKGKGQRNNKTGRERMQKSRRTILRSTLNKADTPLIIVQKYLLPYLCVIELLREWMLLRAAAATPRSKTTRKTRTLPVDPLVVLPRTPPPL